MVLITYVDKGHFESNSTGLSDSHREACHKHKREIDVRAMHEIDTAILTDRGVWKHSLSKMKA